MTAKCDCLPCRMERLFRCVGFPMNASEVIVLLREEGNVAECLMWLHAMEQQDVLVGSWGPGETGARRYYYSRGHRRIAA